MPQRSDTDTTAISETMPETTTARIAPRTTTPGEVRPARGIAYLLFAIALVCELLTTMLMTIYRYEHQNLAPKFLDLGRTANIIGLFFSLLFIGGIVLLMLRERHRRGSISTISMAFAASGLVILTAAPMLTEIITIIPYAGWSLFLLVKVAEIATFIMLLMRPVGPRWRIVLRGIAAGAGTIVLAFLAIILLVLTSPISPSIVEQPRQSYDAGVILGAAVWSGDRPSPVLRERINRGYDLLKNGTVQFLVVTGGNAPNELTEAAVARRELIARGADPTRIVKEDSTSSTLSQILFIRDRMKRTQGWDSFVIISDQFHLKRALEICQFNGINAVGVSSESPLGPQNLVIYHLRESAALIFYWLFGV